MGSCCETSTRSTIIVRHAKFALNRNSPLFLLLWNLWKIIRKMSCGVEFSSRLHSPLDIDMLLSPVINPPHDLSRSRASIARSNYLKCFERKSSRASFMIHDLIEPWNPLAFNLRRRTLKWKFCDRFFIYKEEILNSLCFLQGRVRRVSWVINFLSLDHFAVAVLYFYCVWLFFAAFNFRKNFHHARDRWSYFRFIENSRFFRG